MVPRHGNPWMKLSDPHPVNSFVSNIRKVSYDSYDCDLCVFVGPRCLVSFRLFFFSIIKISQGQVVKFVKIIYFMVTFTNTDITFCFMISLDIFRSHTWNRNKELFLHVYPPRHSGSSLYRLLLRAVASSKHSVSWDALGPN